MERTISRHRSMRSASWRHAGAVSLLVGASQLWAAGLPGEYLLSTRWRDLSGIHSALTNPAFLTEENYVALRWTFAQVLQGAFQLNEMGVTVPIGLYQSAGVTWISEWDGDGVHSSSLFDPATGQILNDPSATTTATNTDQYIILSYAINPWRRLSVGANLTYAMQTNFGDPVMGLGLDVGASYNVLRHPFLGDHLMGISTVNLVAPSMRGSAIKPGNRGEYSRDLRLSWVSNYWERRIELGMDYDLKDFLAAAGEYRSYGVTDSSWKNIAGSLPWGLSMRVGGWILRVINVYGQVGLAKEGVDYWGAAAGVNIPGLNNGRDVQFLYQYNVKTEGDNASVHSFYLRGDVGKHREELYARRMARMADLSPNELYNSAMNLFALGRYWDAFFLFSRIQTDFPDFFKNDWVGLNRARCQEELDMRDAAILGFLYVRQTFPKSEAVAHADLGIMRVNYRNSDDVSVTNQFNALAQPGVPDSLRHHADYLMGETFIRQGEYEKAIQVLALIPETHPTYLFAMHSIAVALVLSKAETEQVLATLTVCVGATPTTLAQREMVNRSYLFFGFLYYEDAALPKAVAALRSVPPESYYYEDALLGLGWCALRAGQATDCIDVGKRLSAFTKKDPIRAEAALIEAYGYMMQKDYASSFGILDAIRTRIAGLAPISDDSLAQHRALYDNARTSYGGLAETADLISRKASSSFMMKTIDSLHAAQTVTKDSIDAFLKYSDEFTRNRLFGRSIDRIQEDIEYAHATVMRLMGESGGSRGKQQAGQEQRKIDEEIRRLKEEMNQTKDPGGGRQK